jgi:hypothetical protein
LVATDVLELLQLTVLHSTRQDVQYIMLGSVTVVVYY